MVEQKVVIKGEVALVEVIITYEKGEIEGEWELL